MIMNREEMIKNLLDQVHELEGIVNGMLKRMDEANEALIRIREESERLRLAESAPSETPEDEPVDDFASSYEIEDEDEEIMIDPASESTTGPSSEPEVLPDGEPEPEAGHASEMESETATWHSSEEQPAPGIGYITDLDEDSAFGCYADFLPENGSEEDDKEEDVPDETTDMTPPATGAVRPEAPVRSNLRKVFSLNDMFRFAVLFGGRNALTELLDKLDRAATPVEVDQLIAASLRKGSEEEVVAEFIEKVHAEKF